MHIFNIRSNAFNIMAILSVEKVNLLNISETRFFDLGIAKGLSLLSELLRASQSIWPV
jgi:hypothetical protein